MNRIHEHRHRALYLMVVPLLLTVATMSVLCFSLIDTSVMLYIYYVHQFFFYALQTLLDGAFLMCIVQTEVAPAATGIVSGIGYAGGMTVPFIILPYSTRFHGWNQILPVVLGLEVLLLLPLVWLAFLDKNRNNAELRYGGRDQF